MLRSFIHASRGHLFWVLLVACGFWGTCSANLIGVARGQEAPAAEAPEAKPASPIGQFVTISGTIDDSVHARVNRLALSLQSRAQKEKRRGVLVVEILPGSSPFHQVLGLARFLSTDLPSLTTVAYIPEKLTGHHVVLALACQEIIMRPDAALGDISLGSALDPDERAFVVHLVDRRHNRKVNEALALGLLDRQREVLWVQIVTGEKPNEVRETRIVTRSGYDDLAKAGAQITDVKTVKEAGDPGVISGERARAYDILAVNTAHSREEVCSVYNLPREAMREGSLSGEAPRAIVIKINDVIEPVLEQFVIRQIDRAISSRMNVVIFEIESPGGYLLTSIDMCNHIADLSKHKIRTVAYIPRKALSGAAVIAMGCDEVYLHADGMIGDAGGIELGAGGQFEFVPQKLLGVFREHLEMMAEKKRRPPAVLLAMMNKDLDVYAVTHRETGRVWYMSEAEIDAADGEWTVGAAVPEAGHDQLLTVDGRRAHELQIAETPVRDFEELQARLGIPPDTKVTVSEKTWVDTLIIELNSAWALALLTTVGIFCLFLEAKIPCGFFGILACVCFGVFFWAHFLGGTAGWLEVVLFLLGAGCIAIEVFLLPGFGVFGISGVILCLFSLVLATQTFVIPHSMSDMEQLTKTLGVLCSAILASVVMGAISSRFLPRMSLFRDMVLVPPGAEAAASRGPQLRPDLLEQSAFINPVLERDRSLVGKQGTSMTVLRPSGKAQIEDDYVDVVSEGPFIPAGRPVEVISVSGTRVVVREIRPA
jgi:membrane-bound serine protease (ClpP class)